MNKTPYFLLFAFMLAGCSAAEASTPPAPTAVLDVYAAPTDTATPEVDLSVPTATPLPLPTATPIVVAVQAGDTLLAIASRYGVKLNDILTANPGIDPQFLSVGTLLTIPRTGEDGVISSLPQPTPIALPLSAPECVADAVSGLWCVTLVENSQTVDIENVVILMQLLNGENAVVASEAATLLLNRLPAGERWPVLVHFVPPLPVWQFAVAQLSAALPVAEVEGRYVAASVADEIFVIAADGKAAKVTGAVFLHDSEPDAGIVLVMVVAYDAAGQVVGVARWEGDGGLTTDAPLPFTAWVYSLGPAIVDVAVVVEALP